MLLCLDIGNTHILGGVFENERLIVRFRYATHLIGTADQFGIFLTSILQANQITTDSITAIASCSVVPSCDYTIKHTINHYFDANYFILKMGAKTGLNIKYKQPNEVGADRIANAIGAINAYPNRNIIVIDMGTATTLCAITNTRDYLGGSILPGIRLNMESLKMNTAKLMEVNIEAPQAYIGRSTRESIQVGLFYSQLGALKEITTGIKKSIFNSEDTIVLGTGGFAQLFRDENLFDKILPDLVLHGLQKAYQFSF